MLSAVEVRPINNIVDITNYVTLDIGQPMHAYDFNLLHEKKLTVRFAKDNEDVRTLDDKHYKLDKQTMVVTDGQSVEDIAGVMGGYKSQINSKTTKVIFEAANWDLYSIRHTSRKLGLRTEASTRFEKGLDPTITLQAVKNAVQLAADLSGSEVVTELFDHYPEPRTEGEIEFDLTLVKRFLGIELTKQEIMEILTRVSLIISDAEKSAATATTPETSVIIKVKVPTFRYDIKNEYDLLEEIARIHGYYKVKPTLPSRDLSAPKTNKLFAISLN
jgi:phenylalanyl-tRNA synthetase beta chain